MEEHVAYGGFSCTPVNAEDTRHCCAVCRSYVLKEPEVTDCCGNYFCASCLRACGETSLACPLCRAPSFTSTRDSREERAMLNMLVYCQHRDHGCRWAGILRTHGAHVIQDCPYGLTECPAGCKQILVRSELPGHLESHCSLRRARCRYCDVEGTHGFVAHSHEKVCPKRPVACPNGCDAAAAAAAAAAGLVQENLPAHLRACPLAKVPCRFAEVGCEAVVPRRDLGEHLASSKDGHLLILLDAVVEMKRALDSSQGDIKSLRSTLRSVQQECERLRRSAAAKYVTAAAPTRVTPESVVRDLQRNVDASRSEPFLPVFVKMGHFDLQRQKGACWYSNPFYTSPAGYKLSLGVFPNGREKGLGTHLAVYVYVTGGEYDDYLGWPLKHDVTVVLRNQQANTHHLHLDCSFTEASPGLRVAELGAMATASEGSGTNQFVLLSKLGRNQQRSTEYLRNDCLYFEVY